MHRIRITQRTQCDTRRVNDGAINVYNRTEFSDILSKEINNAQIKIYRGG